jgi:hypothetical protein
MKPAKDKKKNPKQKPAAHTKQNEKTKFPGYPKYAPEEDIMNKATRVEFNLDKDSINTIANQNKKIAPLDKTPIISKQSEITKEDLEALGPKDLSLDMGDDENLLKHRIYPVDFSGKDIDIPGSELDDAGEAIGSEDEENNGYSIGGDAHDNLEEDPT